MMPLLKNSLSIAGTLWLSSMLSNGTTFHVSVTGADGNDGTESRPWRTLSKATDSVSPGDTVLVGGGVYNEIFRPGRSGSETAWIEFSAKPGETPVIDGTGVSLSNTGKGLVYFGGDVGYIRIRGFEIRNIDNRTSRSRAPIGVAFRESAHDIEVIDCRVHSISTHLEDMTPRGYSIEGVANNITVEGGFVSDVATSHPDGNAHAIAVYGEESTPVGQITIENVTMSEFTLGTSETLVFNGNVVDFKAIGNTIFNSNNIGIDVIGFEGVGPEGADQARNGVISGNTVYGVSTLSNPAYESYSAAGIYVDGGSDVLIERNRVYQCDIGIELASENPDGFTRDIIVRDNLVWRNSIGGILLGGYDRRRGATEGCSIVNNTFFENDTRQFQIGEVNLRYLTNNNSFVNNLFIAGKQGYFVTFPEEFSDSSGNTFDGNGYFTTSRTTGWEWQGQWASSWTAFKRVSGQEASGIYADPVIAGDPDQSGGLHLSKRSPMIDAGLTQVGAELRIDAAGGSRVIGAEIDIGAFEFGSIAQPTQGASFLAIDATDGARTICLLPEIAALDGLRLDFSVDGESWMPIATRTDDDTWSTIDAIEVKTTFPIVTISDTREANSGFYRATTEN